MLHRLMRMWPGNEGFTSILEWLVYHPPKYVIDVDGVRICRYCSAYAGDCGC
jgi:hypothetical protein